MADATFSAGLAALEEGRYADALALFAPLAKQRPRSVEVLLGLASAQLGVGYARAALTTATRAGAIDPNAPAILYVMGSAAAIADEEQRFRQCLADLRKMSAPQAASVGAFWATRLTEHGHFVAAERVQRELVAMLPRDYDVRIARADTLLRLGEADAAGADLAEALQIDETRGEAHALLAQQHLRSGDLDGARESALTAIARNPRLVPAYAALADLDASAIDEPMRAQLRALAGETRSTPENRATAGFALAAALDAQGRYGEAFASILAARRELARADLQRGKPYRREATAAKLAAEMRTFSAALFAKAALSPERGRGLVFIVGMPRCGSTLLDQALASHSQVASRGESMALYDVRRQLDLQLATNRDPNDVIRQHGPRWESMYRSGAPAAPVLIDKNLFNFWNVGFIARLFPAARVLIVRRDPVDVCFSIFRRAFIGEHAFANDLEDLAHYHRCFDRLADHWRALLPQTVLEVRYENLVRDFETGMRAILRHCGLPFEPACLRFHETKRTVATASAAQVRQPLFTAGVGRWRPYARELQPLIEALERHKQI